MQTAIYFDLETEIIKENCKFTFYYNKIDVTPIVLDDGNEIILANMPNNKHIICSINNDIPARIPSHPYVLVNRSVLCNCSTELKYNFLLESLAACHELNSTLVMHFMVNKAFVNYLNQMDNLIEILEFPILKNKTTSEQTLVISLNVSKFDLEWLTAPRTLKDFIHQCKYKKEFFIWKKRMITLEQKFTQPKFLFQ